MSQRITYTVKKEDEGMTLGRLARQRMAVSACLLRQLKRVGDGILLDGQSVYVNVLPKEGQVISLAAGRPESSQNIRPQQGQVDIRYEDELMLIVNKPGGLAVHPAHGQQSATLANYVAGLFQQRGEELVFHAINRLDRGTSGLMCIAKSKYSSALLCKALWQGRISRRYYALCRGQIDPPSGTVDAPIGRAEGFGVKRCVSPDGQPAVTHYSTLKTGRDTSLVCLRLETGRTHQIRVHMAHLGHPLIGDFMYGTEIEGFDRVALHSFDIEVRLDDRHIHVETPPPECFSRFIDL